MYKVNWVVPSQLTHERNLSLPTNIIYKFYTKSSSKLLKDL